MISEDDLITLWVQRRSARGPVMAQMTDLLAHYENAVLVPLPELERDSKATIANHIQRGLDFTAAGVASTVPMLWCPPLEPSKEGSKKRAETRRKAMYGFWEQNRMNLKLRRRARHLVGYGTSPVVVRADVKRGIPRWDVRDPLTCYPSEMVDPEMMVPDDCLFVYQRSAAWVEKRYPEQYAMLGRPRGAARDTNLSVLEYHDEFEMVLLVVSDYGADSSSVSWVQPTRSPTQAFRVVLERAENLTGQTQVVIPGRITLGGRTMGQFDGILPMFKQQALLEALQLIAVEKAIFPDAYLVSRPNEVAKFIVGPFDGRTGQVNVVEGGQIEYINTPGSPQTNLAIDRLERNQRVTAGVPSEVGGESPTNVRTGKRGDAIIETTVDFGIQEAQEILSASLQDENRIAVAVACAHFGNVSRSFMVSWKNAAGPADYTPSVDFDSDYSVVTFAAQGRDVNGLTVSLLQRVGAGSMSKETAQEIDPFISDPQQEQQRVMLEAVDTAILASISALAQSGQMAPQDATFLKRRLVLGDSIEDALDKVQKAAQERQAPSVAPVAPDAPAAQPGVAPAGQGAEAGTIPPAPQDQQDIADILRSLQGAQRNAAA